MGNSDVATLHELSPAEIRILITLDRRPATVMDMSEELDLTPAVITMYLRRLQSANMVKVCEQRFLGNQVQNVFGLVPDSRVKIRANGGPSAKLLQFCDVLTQDVREHIDDNAQPGSFTAGLTIARIPSDRLPIVMEHIKQLVSEMESLEEKAQDDSYAIAIAVYPRLNTPTSKSEGRSESQC